MSEAGSDIAAHSPGGAGGSNLSSIKEEPGLAAEEQTSSVQVAAAKQRRPKSTRPSKYMGGRRRPGVHESLCFVLRPPPCIVNIRRKTKNLRKHFRNPYKTLQMGAAMQALIRFESQAVKSRPRRRPIDDDREKKKARVYYMATSAPSRRKAANPTKKAAAAVHKPLINVPITPWSKSAHNSANRPSVPVLPIQTHRKMHLFDIDIPGKITFKGEKKYREIYSKLFKI